jgi:hypothetical protein
MTHKIGYSFWGYLGDIKRNKDLHRMSTPDGNAFYSWSIVNAFIDVGYDVMRVMPNRDNAASFESWGYNKRLRAYNELNEHAITWPDLKELRTMSIIDMFDLLDRCGLAECDFILHEWRMNIPGRNDLVARNNESNVDWQPDYYIQSCLMKYCKLRDVKIVVFDLDYSLDQTDITYYGIDYVIELGNRDRSFEGVTVKKVFIPFDFSIIDTFGITIHPAKQLVYVGNRYDRDEQFEKYITDSDNLVKSCNVYGNWLEGGRGSDKKWPDVTFKPRLQTEEMRGAYQTAAATVLLAKDDYCKYSFMTARIIEAVFYGVVPFMPIELASKNNVASEFLGGKYCDYLTADSASDLYFKTRSLQRSYKKRKEIISYLRKHLEFMDASYFAKDVCSLVKGEKK